MIIQKERPILFSAPMVRAILEGRKTQTRRVQKLPKWAHPGTMEEDARDSLVADTYNGCTAKIACPYGKPGDQLWVREAHAIMSTDGRTASVAYRERVPAGKTLADTDGGLDLIELSTEELIWADAHIDAERWRPSIFMPRWASRITLEITEVRVERLQDSVRDAIAEGCDPLPPFPASVFAPEDYLPGYRKLWESINGAGSWNANPWVWAVSFKVVQP